MRRPLSAVSSAAGPPGPADLTAAAIPLRPGAPAAIITRGGRAAQATVTTPGAAGAATPGAAGAATPSGGASGTPSGGASGTSGDGTVFRGGLATALTATGISATVALAKLTTGGTNGSATFSQGILTAYVPPT